MVPPSGLPGNGWSHQLAGTDPSVLPQPSVPPSLCPCLPLCLPAPWLVSVRGLPCTSPGSVLFHLSLCLCLSSLSLSLLFLLLLPVPVDRIFRKPFPGVPGGLWSWLETC